MLVRRSRISRSKSPRSFSRPKNDGGLSSIRKAGNSSIGVYGNKHTSITKTASGIPIKSDTGYSVGADAQRSGGSDFTYLENPNPQEFLVYFIVSEKLKAVKIGVGTSGRVIQLLNSHVRSDGEDQNVGWKVLRTAAFSNSKNFESGRDAAYEAERRVLFYWRKHLELSGKVSERDMGWSELNYFGTRGFYRTAGYTETAEIFSICEVTTWKIVMQSPGYLREGSSFHSGRELRLNEKKSFLGGVPPSYSEYRGTTEPSKRKSHLEIDQKLVGSSFSTSSGTKKERTRKQNRIYPESDGTQIGDFWSRVDKQPSGCWNWLGHITDEGYALMLWDNKSTGAHRVSWILEHCEMPAQLHNTCGSRGCVNSAHWVSRLRAERICLTHGCLELSTSKTKGGYCEKCRSRRRRNPSLRDGYCEKCKSQRCVAQPVAENYPASSVSDTPKSNQ